MNNSFRSLQPCLGDDLDFGVLRAALFRMLLCSSLEAREYANGKSQADRSQALSMQAVLHRSRLAMTTLLRDCQFLQATSPLCFAGASLRISLLPGDLSFRIGFQW